MKAGWIGRVLITPIGLVLSGIDAERPCSYRSRDRRDRLRGSKVFFSGLIIVFALATYGCLTMEPKATVTHADGPSIQEARMERYDGPRARIAVGDFQVKASDATTEIGDGIREMLLTSLFNSDRFIVLERQAIEDVLLEQDLGASGRVKRETAPVIGELEGAEILVFGVVSEFQMGSKGGGLLFSLPELPFRFGGGTSEAHMALDLRLVDTTTGRILCATRVEGKAADFDAMVSTRIGGGSTTMPVALNSYRNTPMEKAIRVTIDEAVRYIVRRTPQKYFHY